MNPAIEIAAPVSAAAVAALAYATIWPSAQVWGPAIWHGPRDSNRVAITFDDGPTAGSTERVLDELRKHHVPATFFAIGENVQNAPDVLRRIDAEGHQVGNHTFSHSYFGVLRGPRFWQRELAQTDEMIDSIVHKRPAFFRPPLGAKSRFVVSAAGHRGMTVVTWSLRAVDGIPTTAEKIMQRFSSVRGGDILVLHDGADPRVPHRDRSAAANVIEPLSKLLRERQLEPVRLDSLLDPTPAPAK